MHYHHMNSSTHLAKHLNQVMLGGNWTSMNYNSVLTDLPWQKANQQVQGLMSIAKLTFHATYYIDVLLRALKNQPLNAKDELSFNTPPINSQQDWDNLLKHIFTNSEEVCELIQQLPDEQLNDHFTDEKYGSFFRNINGIIEHLHYHLGQIVLIKKLLQ